MSDRIIDCPVKVIVIAVDWGRAAPIAHAAASRTAKPAHPADNRALFNVAVPS